MSDVAHTKEVKRSKRETGDADSDSYEEYKSDEEGRGGGGEDEDALKNEVKIISVQQDDKVVDGITEKGDTSKKEAEDKKAKKKKEKRSKHAEGAENVDGQERKDKKKEKKSREGKKDKKSKEHREKEKTGEVKTEKVEEERKVVTFEEVSQKEQPKTVEITLEKAEQSKPSETTAAVPTKIEDEAAPVAPTEDAPLRQSEEVKAEHPVVSTEVTPAEAPLPDAKEEKTAAPVVLAEVAPSSDPPVSEKIEDVVHPEAAPSEAAAAESTLSETASVPANESLSESQSIAVSQPPVAESNPPEPSPPYTDAAVTETGNHLPPKSDTNDQENAVTSTKTEEPQASLPTPTGVQQILEHARKEAEASATGSSRLLMARNLVSRQEKLQEQLTNMRHQFGDIDSEIRALKIDCYRNQRAFPKHQ